jgi:hypothetical protein
MTPDVPDSFGDRRLSDLLPTEIVRQIGFDPESFLFDRTTFTTPRRMTDPGLLTFPLDPPFQRRSNTIDPARTFAITSWFLVELSDATVPAFSTFPITFGRSGVVVRDGQYLRFGRLVEEMRTTPQLTQASCQIFACDKEYQLSDYLGVQTELAGHLARSFLLSAKCPAEFVSVETVSYRGRSLFRLRLSDADAPNAAEVVRLMIQAFGVAVEVFD